MEIVKTDIPAQHANMFKAFMCGRYREGFEIYKGIDDNCLVVAFDSGQDATEFKLKGTNSEFAEFLSSIKIDYTVVNGPQSSLTNLNNNYIQFTKTP